MWLECHHGPCHQSLANPGMCIPSRSAACPLPSTHAPQVLTDNPLADFVELPEEYGDLHYCNLLPGVLRGALEQVGGWEGVQRPHGVVRLGWVVAYVVHPPKGSTGGRHVSAQHTVHVCQCLHLCVVSTIQQSARRLPSNPPKGVVYTLAGAMWQQVLGGCRSMAQSVNRTACSTPGCLTHQGACTPSRPHPSLHG